MYIENNQDEEIKLNMRKKIVEFDKTYKNYLSGEANDEALTDVATQPFWQSLRLSKKRLMDKGIQLDTSMSLQNKSTMTTESFSKDGKNIVGTFARKVIFNRSYKKDGQEIYKKKEKKLCIATSLKSEGDGDMAACPNCGHVGKISKFIDGCDYCNTKFEVRDFEEKISAYSIEEDVPGKTKSMLKRMLITIGAILGVMIITAIAAISISIFSDMNNTALNEANYSAAALMVVISVFPMFWKMFFFTLFIFLIAVVILFICSKKRVEPNGILMQVTQHYDSFSSEDFAQQLEYKLRNIHFADDASKVNVFANIDLSNIVKSYENVIECSLIKVRMLSCNFAGNKDELLIKAYLRLTRIDSGNIYEENERIILYLSAVKNMKVTSLGGIRNFTCKNCGNSISILGGGISEACDSRLNYEDYSWMIEKYYSNVDYKKTYEQKTDTYAGKKRYMDTFLKTRLIMTSLFISIFVIGSIITYSNNKELLNPVFHYNEYVNFANEYYDNMIELKDVDSSVEQINYRESFFTREYEYSCSTVDSTVNDFVSRLCADNYEIADQTEDSYELVKELDNTIGSENTTVHHVYIDYYDNYIMISEEFDDE